jgi:hypothetical protein
MTEQDTFDKLRRCDIAEVEQAALDAHCGHRAVDVTVQHIECCIAMQHDSANALLFAILQAHHWNLTDFLKQAKCKWILYES